MRKLMILQGLPASGKSTYAHEHVDAHTVTVSMDGIRRMLTAGENVQETYYRGVRCDNPRIERDVVDEGLVRKPGISIPGQGRRRI